MVFVLVVIERTDGSTKKRKKERKTEEREAKPQM